MQYEQTKTRKPPKFVNSTYNAGNSSPVRAGRWGVSGARL